MTHKHPQKNVKFKNRELSARGRVTNSGMVAASKSEMEIYQGSLPHPDHLKQFDEAVPGAARDIIDMAKSQQSHRQSLEAQLVQQAGLTIVGTQKTTNRAIIASFAIMMTAILCGTFLIFTGHDATGIAALMGAIATLGVSIYSAAKTQKPQADNQVDPPADDSDSHSKKTLS